MTNSRAKFSAVAALAVSLLMVFTTGALGQDAVSSSIGSGSAALMQTSLSQVFLGQAFLSQTFISKTVLSQAPVGLLLLGPDLRRPAPQRPAPQRPAPQPPNNGCGNRNGGWDQWGGGGKCSAVPEGGTTFAYLALVGLCCVATAIFSIRRQARATK
jgi:hypothetical protein